MAWVAVDKGGTEILFEGKPHRIDDYLWAADSYYDKYVELPSGSIKKLIGRDLTWENEPVELK